MFDILSNLCLHLFFIDNSAVSNCFLGQRAHEAGYAEAMRMINGRAYDRYEHNDSDETWKGKDGKGTGKFGKMGKGMDGFVKSTEEPPSHDDRNLVARYRSNRLRKFGVDEETAYHLAISSRAARAGEGMHGFVKSTEVADNGKDGKGIGIDENTGSSEDWGEEPPCHREHPGPAPWKWHGPRVRHSGGTRSTGGWGGEGYGDGKGGSSGEGSNWLRKLGDDRNLVARYLGVDEFTEHHLARSARAMQGKDGKGEELYQKGKGKELFKGFGGEHWHPHGLPQVFRLRADGSGEGKGTDTKSTEVADNGKGGL